jgi:hypothetical protein
MKKHKKWIFTVFVIVVFVAILTALVLVQRNKNNTDEKTYAKSLYVNLPSTIIMLKGTKAELMSGYVSVSPNEMMSELNIEVTNNIENSNGLVLQNNVLSANYVGEYTIKFSIPKSETQKLTRSISVIVHDEETYAHVYKNQNSIIVGESNSIFNLCTFNSNNHQIETYSNLILNGNIITPQEVGSSSITFSFQDDYIKYFYELSFITKDVPQFEIVLEGATNNTLTLSAGSVTYINYEVKNREEGDIEQEVFVVSADESIIEILNFVSPNIKVKANNAGETTITITYLQDISITLEIKIIVV